MTNWYTEQAANLNSIAFALEHHGVDNRKEVKNFLVDLLEKSEHEYVYDIYFMYPDKHIPIIALSANAFEEDKLKSLESGMTTILKSLSLSRICFRHFQNLLVKTQKNLLNKKRRSG